MFFSISAFVQSLLNEKLRTITYEVNPYNKYMTTEYCIKNPFDEKCKFDSDAGLMSEKEFDEYVASQLEAKKVQNMSLSA